MKKLISALCAVVLCVCMIIPLAACNQTDNTAPQKVMTMELNPSVEFILDGNDKVVSVNALNEDGNLVLCAQTENKKFEGCTSEQAAELYISICKENGFFVKANVKSGENELKISFSGEQAQADYEALKAKVEGYLSKENIDATVKKGMELAETYLNEQLKKCAPYINDAKLAALGYMEKIEELAKSRQETAEMHSQALKDAYYSAKENAFNQARFDAVKASMSDLQKAALKASEATYKALTAGIESTRKNVFTDADSAYQQALVIFQEQKAAFLNYRNYLRENNITDHDEQLDKLQAAYEKAENNLVSAYDSAIALLDSAQEAIDNAYASVVEAIKKMGIDFDKAVDDAQTTINDSLTAFETRFASDYDAAISAANKGWNDMKDWLKKGYQPEEEQA